MMAYASWSVVFGEQPSAAKWNILGTNDASFNDGTGIAGLYKNLLTVDSNPYKFSAYKTAAQNVGTAATKVNFETELFDTNSNYDNVTNFRYAAPVSGFYQFNSTILCTGAGSGNTLVTYLYKNGSLLKTIGRLDVAAAASPGISAPAFIQLTAADFVEIYAATGTAAKALDVAAPGNNDFTGFLYCRT